MQINIQEIAQELIDELLKEEEKNKHRIEGIAALFYKIQESYTAQLNPPTEEQSSVEG